MRIDFYHLTDTEITTALPAIAERSLSIDKKMLILAEAEELRHALSQALWRHSPSSFLAHGEANGDMAMHQPILLSTQTEPINGAVFVAIGDGQWRQEVIEKPRNFERLFYFFNEETIREARSAWAGLAEYEQHSRHYWKQIGGKWVEAA